MEAYGLIFKFKDDWYLELTKNEEKKEAYLSAYRSQEECLEIFKPFSVWLKSDDRTKIASALIALARLNAKVIKYPENVQDITEYIKNQEIIRLEGNEMGLSIKTLGLPMLDTILELSVLDVNEETITNYFNSKNS